MLINEAKNKKNGVIAVEFGSSGVGTQKHLFFGSIEHACGSRPVKQGMAQLSSILSLSMCRRRAEDVGVELHVVVDVL